jgi:hypothetical protein
LVLGEIHAASPVLGRKGSKIASFARLRLA